MTNQELGIHYHRCDKCLCQFECADSVCKPKHPHILKTQTCPICFAKAERALEERGMIEPLIKEVV